MEFKIGNEVVAKHDIDVYPHCIVPKGTQGTVTSVPSARQSHYEIKLKKDFPALAEWENELHVYPVDERELPSEQVPNGIITSDFLMMGTGD